MDGGERLRPWWGAALRHGNGREKRGERRRSSPRSRRAAQRGRGRPGDGESTAADGGARGGRRWRWWLLGALRLAWLGEEVAGDEAELLGTTGRRGRGGGYGDARRRRRWFSGEREREQGEKRRARESESGAGQLRGFVRGIEGVRGSRRWPAGGEVARARAGERRAHARPPGRGGRRQGRGGQAGWAASWLGRPAAAGLRRGGEAQVSPSFLYFCFLIFLTLF